MYEGHRGDSKYRGTYTIRNDTIILNESTNTLEELRFLKHNSGCLVELETRFSYCQRKNGQLGGEKIAINYPQLEERNQKEKREVIDLLNIALTNPELEKYFDPAETPMIIQEYHQINANSNVRLSYTGEEAQIVSLKEIEENEISRYLTIEDVTIGLESAMIKCRVMPEEHIGVLDFFTRQNGKWKLRERLR